MLIWIIAMDSMLYVFTDEHAVQRAQNLPYSEG